MKTKFHGVMMKIEQEMEIRQISMYCDIIKNVLKEHHSLSIPKMCVFAFLIKQECVIDSVIFRNTITTNVVSRYLSLLIGKFEQLEKSYEFIFKALNILIINSVIKNQEGMLSLLKIENSSTLYEEREFTKKVIEESKKWSDKRFMREVLYNV